jgi:hypothetical protein
MNLLLLLLAPVTALYWPQTVESAPALRQAGIERLCVPPDLVEVWRKAGFSAVPMSAAELASREQLPTPGITGRVELASATRSPWIFANGWRFIRKPTGKYAYDLPKGTAALAAAEAFAYGADAVLKIDPADLEPLGRMWAFLATLPAVDLPAISDIAVVDDGSQLLGEVMNLLARRNLLFRPVDAPSPEFRINVRLGTKEYPEEEAADPSAFALKIRRQLGDEHRVLRVYGSEVVVCRLTGDRSRVRLHLVNYGGREIEGVSIRLRGSHPEGEARVVGLGTVPPQELVVSEGATEFSIPRMGTYAVIDLPAVK